MIDLLQSLLVLHAEEGWYGEDIEPRKDKWNHREGAIVFVILVLWHLANNGAPVEASSNFLQSSVFIRHDRDEQVNDD